MHEPIFVSSAVEEAVAVVELNWQKVTVFRSSGQVGDLHEYVSWRMF